MRERFAPTYLDFKDGEFVHFFLSVAETLLTFTLRYLLKSHRTMDYLYLQYFYVIQTIQSSEFLVNSEMYKIAENSEKKNALGMYEKNT